MATRPLTPAARTTRPITPHFAWILLLDLVALCRDLLAVGFAESHTASTGPLLARYEGDPECEWIARNAIQCLHFEALETIGGGKRTRNPVFRLEFWITRDKLRVMIDALVDCVRQHIVHEARVRPYMGLLENELEIHPSVLVPSKRPLFSLINPHTLGNGTQDMMTETNAISGPQGGLSYKDYKQKRGSVKPKNGVDDSERFFGIQPSELQKMAYAVSVLSTDALADFTSTENIKLHNTHPALHHTNDYADLSKVAVETVCEVLEDPTIKAAIERRARDKFTNLLKAREEYPSKTSLEKERLIIERAEREAEDMIKRIMRQMALKNSQY
ncbi:unnamed protein product [Phytomonas sp. Hart1]|nr:unnamed protein product [Phytomonas sp. Hart1]|eukprot:CCW67470.1 unnamed protein product [Phytomonas sp. isolate Hart1]